MALFALPERALCQVLVSRLSLSFKRRKEGKSQCRSTVTASTPVSSLKMERIRINIPGLHGFELRASKWTVLAFHLIYSCHHSGCHCHHPRSPLGYYSSCLIPQLQGQCCERAGPECVFARRREHESAVGRTACAIEPADALEELGIDG